MKIVPALAALSLAFVGTAAFATDYPPCSATRTDSCIQKQLAPVKAHPIKHSQSHR